MRLVKLKSPYVAADHYYVNPDQVAAIGVFKSDRVWIQFAGCPREDDFSYAAGTLDEVAAALEGTI